MSTPKTDNSNERESAAQMVWKSENEGQTLTVGMRVLRIYQYGKESSYAGEWWWGVRDVSNWELSISGIVEDENEAKTHCFNTNNLTDEEFIEAAAAKHLETITEAMQKLTQIGYQPRADISYARGYDDGHKAALTKLQAFLDNEQPEGE